MTTFQQIINDARVLLNDVVIDESTVTRYTEPQLLGYVREAIVAARRMRPDLFLSNMTGAFPVYAATDTVPMSEQYNVALVDYVVHRAEIRDDEFAVSGKADMMFAKFKAGLLGL